MPEALPEGALALDVAPPGEVRAGSHQIAEADVELLLGHVLEHDEDEIVAPLRLEQPMLRQMQLELAPLALHVRARQHDHHLHRAHAIVHYSAVDSSDQLTPALPNPPTLLALYTKVGSLPVGELFAQSAR